MLILIQKKKKRFLLMSCLMSVLLELACLIGIYNMTYNISTVIHILECLFAQCLIFDHNFKFVPKAVLLCGISDSFLGGSSDSSTWHPLWCLVFGLNPTSPVPHYLPFKKISEFLSPMTHMIK